ncbi:persephin [Tachyglossus aculeatus]|uniref:persephin n=1 Tax=Tachyglossus aculeatus TaxID=9261 RepID=UPI0018F3FEC7|nr:persephin [Tachyglossus aculeatus]
MDSALLLLGFLLLLSPQPGVGETPPAPDEDPGIGGSQPAAPRGRPPRSLGGLDPACRLRSLPLQVKELGLGYASDETIVFRYCAGRCPRARTQHALTLARLLQGQAQWHGLGEPCCRPTRYEDVAFLDNQHQWHHLPELSAGGCSCVG